MSTFGKSKLCECGYSTNYMSTYRRHVAKCTRPKLSYQKLHTANTDDIQDHLVTNSSNLELEEDKMSLPPPRPILPYLQSSQKPSKASTGSQISAGAFLAHEAQISYLFTKIASLQDQVDELSRRY